MRIKKSTAFASVAVIVTLVFACTEGQVDLDEFKRVRKEYTFLDTPSEVEMLVGDEMTLPVSVSNSGGARITAESNDYGVVSVYERDDTTILFRAVSEGTATVCLSCLENTYDVKVTVTEVYLEDFTITPSSVDVEFSEEDQVKLSLEVTPASYPVAHLKKTISDTSVVNAVALYDSASARNVIRVFPNGVGETDITFTGMRKDGTKVTRRVPVTVRPIPVESLVLRALSDSVFVGYDTLYTLENDRKVIKEIRKKFRYVYTDMPDPAESIGRKDTVVMDLGWLPDNATVVDGRMTISYLNTTTVLKLKDGEAGVDADSLMHSMDSLGVDSPDEFDKLFGSDGVGEGKYSNYCVLASDSHGFFSYRIIPRKPGNVVFSADIQYVADMDGNKKRVRKRFVIKVLSKDHLSEKERWW